MKKHYFIIMTLVIITATMLSGCANKNNTQVEQKQSTNQAQSGQNRPEFNWQENFNEAAITDLTVGSKVSIMGTENDDGSTVAERIIIGGETAGFGPPAGMDRMPGDNNMPNLNNPQSPSGERPNFEQFQNMSEEERQKMREEMMARRGGGVMPRFNNGQHQARLEGEIINQDKQTITIKLNDGGSKLIFISDNVIILTPKEQT